MSQVRTVQALLSSLGFPASATGGWDLTTASALMGFQQAAGLVPTGELDAVTRHRLLGPLAPPIGG